MIERRRVRPAARERRHVVVKCRRRGRPRVERVAHFVEAAFYRRERRHLDRCARAVDAFGKRAQFVGTERADALLSNTSRMREKFAAPEVSIDQMREWVAQWIEEGGPLLGKATKFEARDGRF